MVLDWAFFKSRFFEPNAVETAETKTGQLHNGLVYGARESIFGLFILINRLFFYADLKRGFNSLCPFPILRQTDTDTDTMHFLLEDLIKQKENEEGKKIARPSMPSVVDALRNDYYKRKKLTLKEKWALIWGNECYPLV